MSHYLTRWLGRPFREYGLMALLLGAILTHVMVGAEKVLLFAALLGSIVPFWGALTALRERRITIEAFNFFALVVSFVTGEYLSAVFIALMLTIASWLDWKTEARATNAVEELLRLKPVKATRETERGEVSIEASEIRPGDILIVREGDRIPADGVVVFGHASVNEASLTGESRPIEKSVGDEVFTATLSEAGVIKIRATKVGKDSTLERMARLIESAAENKSKAERLADRFAGIFLPIVLCAGAVTYIVTGDITMMAALFLIVCADDIAVSIPLAVAAALGHAAKRGVIIKGGERLRALARINTLAFDKTGTLTHGTFGLARAIFEPHVAEETLWRLVSMAERLSEHPVGKALAREASKRTPGSPPETEEVRVIRGVGIWARGEGHEVALGNDQLPEHFGYEFPLTARQQQEEEERSARTALLVFIDGVYAGILSVADTLKEESKGSIAELRAAGVRLVMLTGDNEDVARSTAAALGIDDYHAGLMPESKLRIVSELAHRGRLAMVGDGINDAPALARADVGIAMGERGTAVAVEAADIVILTDRIDRIPEMIRLARRTVSVVNVDMAIWFLTNAVGIALVFAGIATPAFAALYNLLTDFLPLANSARLFRQFGKGDAITQ
jgi:heavy metal translocating P-type ATPase